MPPEPLPWDRKDFFKERKHERSSESLGPASRWREAPHHGSSSREFARWGSAEARSRPLGHGRQGGGWHMVSEESSHGFTPSRSNEKILDEESCRPIGGRGDGKHVRSSRENRGSFTEKDWRGHSREKTVSPKGPGRPHNMSDQRSVNDSLAYTSLPHSELALEQVHLKDQNDQIVGVHCLGTGQRLERENSLGSVDWKPLKWARSGSLSSRGSGFSHSSSSKSMGVDSIEAKADVLTRIMTPVRSPSGDALACVTSASPSEEMNSRKKPRLGWGEGLAKYEKKKVEGPEDNTTKNETNICSNSEPCHSYVPSLADKSPQFTRFMECGSPATPSPVACSSSPGGEGKSLVKESSIGDDTSKLSRAPNIVSQDHHGESTFHLENLELTLVTNVSSKLNELLQFDDLSSLDSAFVRSTAMNKLLIWKGDVLKAVESTESEIDLLENELKSMMSQSGNGCPRPASSSSLPDECHEKLCKEQGVSCNLISRPMELQLVSSEDMITENKTCALTEERYVEKNDIDSPGTATSKFVELISSAKDVRSDKLQHSVGPANLDANGCTKLEVKCSAFAFIKEEKGECGSRAATHVRASSNHASSSINVSLDCDKKDMGYELLLASNRDCANRASEVFNKLLPTDPCNIHISRDRRAPSSQNSLLIKEKFATRKSFLRFKERVITLKFRAFQHLWKEDIRLLSLRKYRAKSQKRFEINSRITHSGYQKNRSSIRSRFASPAGNLSLVPTTEILNFAGKLLADSQIKIYRDTLKMPALLLDRKEKMTSKFISSNGLVEDPCGVEKERTMINPWMPEEREIFMEKFATFGKDFKKIASFLTHKTMADCVEFYYKNHKSDCFEKIKKKSEAAKQGKPYSMSSYLVASVKRWNREMNAASLDTLGEASAIAADADMAMEIQQKRRAYKTEGEDGVLERSGSLDIFSSERETVAADVLAGICGSMSSEAMSSCITSSFDPGEGYQEWKCQKVGSLSRRPLTPDVTQSVDDETCSDESCGELDSGDWTDEEKSIFIQAVSSYGKDFAMISRCVRTRSRDQCRVFFSKARKCLGLDMIHTEPGNDERPMSDNVNGGGSDSENTCLVSVSVVCDDKSDSKMEEDLPFTDLSNHVKSDPSGRINLHNDLNMLEESHGAEQQDCEDAKINSENMVSDNHQQQGSPELDFDGDCNLENGSDRKSTTVEAHKNVALSCGTEVRGAEVTGGFVEESVSNEERSDPCESISGAEVDAKVVVEVSAEGSRTDLGGQQQSPENLNDRQDENINVNVGCRNDENHTEIDCNEVGNTPRYVADLESCVDLKYHPGIPGELAPSTKPCGFSLQQEDCSPGVNSVQQDNAAIQSSNLDLEKIGDERCQNSASLEGYDRHWTRYSLVNGVESSQSFNYPLQSSIKEEVNGDSSCSKLASFPNHPQSDKNYHSDGYLSQDCHLRRCNGSKAHKSVTELSFMSQDQSRKRPSSHSRSSSDAEKPCGNGDVKLFGQILTHKSSQQKPNSVEHENGDRGVQNPKLSGKSFNLKLTGAHSLDNSVLSLERNNYLGLENIPMSYGFWDGSRIQTGFPSLPDSAILLAKYPAAFSNYPAPSTKMEQQPLHSVVKNNERSLNGVTVFPTREISSSSSSSGGVSDYQQLSGGRDGIKAQPFTIDMKQRQDMLFSEMQRRNGFDALPSIQQQGRGMVGINVMGRGGILVGGACTGVSDPVAAIKMHYAKAEQYGAKGSSIFGEEEGWRGKGDIGR